MSERKRSEGVVWEREALSRDRRFELLGRRGATVWFTGLPASGKSTMARTLTVRLVEAGVPAYRLDGDNLRHGLNGDLGFDAASRVENVRRAARFHGMSARRWHPSIEPSRDLGTAGLVANPVRVADVLERFAAGDTGRLCLACCE